MLLLFGSNELTIVKARNRGPEFLLPQPGHGVGGVLARVWPGTACKTIQEGRMNKGLPVPLVFREGDNGDGVRRVLKEVVVPWLFTSDDVFRLSSNVNHGVTEPVKLFECFRLGGLNQHASGDGP